MEQLKIDKKSRTSPEGRSAFEGEYRRKAVQKGRQEFTQSEACQ